MQKYQEFSNGVHEISSFISIFTACMKKVGLVRNVDNENNLAENGQEVTENKNRPHDINIIDVRFVTLNNFSNRIYRYSFKNMFKTLN